VTAASPRDVLARSGRTFYLASRLLPPRMCEDATLLYAFCRRMDDLADDGSRDGGQVLARVLTLLQTAPLGGEIAALGWPVVLEERFPLISRVAAQLTAALAADTGPRRIASEADLEAYAWGVAGTVGIMMCRILRGGAPTTPAEEAAAELAAAELGKAMQLTNIARDVEEDLGRDRIYLPADWVAASSVRAAVAGGEPAPLVQATERLLLAADRLYARGYAGMHFLPWRARVSILAAAACYREIGVRVGRDTPLSWRQRAVVPAGRKAVLVLRAFFASFFVPRGERTLERAAARPQWGSKP
jgi:phytoene synthase